MRTCDILTTLLKAAGVGTVAGLVTTTTAIGAGGLVRSTTNLFSSIPTNSAECLDTFAHQKHVDSKIALWSLLAFVPGFLFGALYYLSKRINLANPSALQYETIDDNDRNVLVTTENQLPESWKKFLISLVTGLSLFGILYGPFKVATNEIDRSTFLPANCHSDMREQAAIVFTISVVVFGMIFGCTALRLMEVSCNNTTQILPTQQKADEVPQQTSHAHNPPLTDRTENIQYHL